MQPTQSVRMFFSATKAAETCDDSAKLESLYYIMVRERKFCNCAAQEQLNKQQQVIENLVKEQEALKRDLNILSAAAKMQTDDINKKTFQAEAAIVMDKTLKKEKDRQGVLDREITSLMVEVIKFKKQKSVVTQSSERDRCQSTLGYLEKKLMRTLNCLDQKVSNIRKLKTELKNQHEENARLQHFRTTYPHKKVTNDLGVYIKDNMNCTTLACENRINVDRKIEMMKKKEQQALAKNQRILNEQAALFPEEIIQNEVEAKVETPVEPEEVNEDELEEVDPGDEEVNLDDEEINLDDEKEVTLDLLVTKFIQGETKKCALYTLITDQYSQIEDVKEEIRQLNAEVHHSSKKGHTNEKACVSFLTGLKDKCTKLLSEVEDYENHEEIINNNLGDIKTVMAGILSNLEWDCPEEDAGEDTTEDTSSVEDKIMSYLKMLEEKTAGLLNTQAYTKAEVSRLLQGE